MIVKPNKVDLMKLIKKFDSLEWPDDNLVEKIMISLGIHDIIEMEFCLNSRFKRERDAAMKMLVRYLDELTSGNHEQWMDAKDTLKQVYYQVDSTDEEAIL